MIWRNPIAWLGLASLLIPIAIHLLVRQQAETRAFPSLRFILPSRLAAIRRRFITDWALLAVRVAMLAMAVAALADPLWQTAARRAAWSNRIARAIVVDTSASARGAAGAIAASANTPAAATAVTGGATVRGAGAGGAVSGDASATDATARGATARDATADGASVDGAERARRAAQQEQQEAAGAFRSTMVETSALGDGIRRAVDWLRTAPPARREIVILSDFQIGALDASMLRDVPAHVGLRFVRTSAAPATRRADGRASTFRATAANVGVEVRTPHVTLTPTDTTVEWTSAPSTASSTSPSTSSASGSSASLSASAASGSSASTAPASSASDSSASASSASASASATRTVTPAIRVANDDDLILDPFNVRLRTTATDRPFARAAADAVLATAVMLPAADSLREARPIAIVAAGAGTGADAAAALPRDVAPLSSPWMADMVDRILTDRELAAAIAHTMAPSNNVAAPWIVAARDVRGQPALLVASRAVGGRGVGGSGARASANAVAGNATNTGAGPSAAAPADAAAAAGAELVLVSRVPAADAATAFLIRATLRALGGIDPLLEAEVMTLPDATLTQFQRPATDPPPAELQDLDSADRRWFWGATLLLFALERFLRRSRRRHDDSQTEGAYEHAA